MKFLWGLPNQRERVVGLSWRPTADFSRHKGIIKMIKDGQEGGEVKDGRKKTVNGLL